MAHEAMRTCRIEQVGKQRNGHPRYWCTTHKASATGRHGIRLEDCELAYRFIEYKDVFDLDVQQWPGGIALWGAVAPVFDTTSLSPEVGIHVHARRAPDGDKDIDHTYEAVRIKHRRHLFDDSDTLITSETAVNYYLSKFMGREVRHLFCIRCGELHLDAGYFAIKPHKNHLCHGCGHLFRDNAKSVSNPIALLLERPDIPQAAHEIGSANRKLEIKQADCQGGIQIWASNPAFLWTGERKEEEGLHVHAYGADGKERHNDTYSEVVIDSVVLNEEHIRYFMAQNALPFLNGRIRSLNCPECGTSHFASGDAAFVLRSEHQCGHCGARFKTPGKTRLVVTNPFVEIRERLMEGKSVGIRRRE